MFAIVADMLRIATRTHDADLPQKDPSWDAPLHWHAPVHWQAPLRDFPGRTRG